MTAPATAADVDARRTTRDLCARCGRPLVVCVCSHVTILPTRTRVLLLQHPRERRVGVGTARLAHVALPNSMLRVGLDFARDPVVSEIVAAGAPAYVLFPGPGAVDISGIADLARGQGLTLVVLDGTWWQARKLLRLNPALAALPRVAFTPRRPSVYRIRRQPAEYCVSTIEALAEALTVLEPGAGCFERLLDPFRAMVARQEWFATDVRSQRHSHPARRRRVTRRTKLAARLVAAWPRVVCVQGEANAWPTRAPGRPDPEIVHWVAHRPATGENYEAVVAPRQPLAPSTPAHVELPAERLLAGVNVVDWRRSWQAFSGPGDLLVTWGHFYDRLAACGGLALGDESIDLRPEVSQILRLRFGAVEECLVGLGIDPRSLALAGRAGRRLGGLVAAVVALHAAPVETPDGQGCP